MALTLTSPAFSNEETIPRQYTCDGADQSPPLRWTGAPPETQSFALIVHDPDAPRGDFTHWVLFDIPADMAEIPEGAAPDGVGTGAERRRGGTNDFGKEGYGGPCPPPGHGRHRYFFTLYSLDRGNLGLGRGARRAEVEAAMQGHVLAQAQLMGTYERR
jgi:Raf kinase inhibitor-like YbhB/YbcL family protein